jgi:hypothetical protein
MGEMGSQAEMDLIETWSFDFLVRLTRLGTRNRERGFNNRASDLRCRSVTNLIDVIFFLELASVALRVLAELASVFAAE